MYERLIDDPDVQRELLALGVLAMVKLIPVAVLTAILLGGL